MKFSKYNAFKNASIAFLYLFLGLGAIWRILGRYEAISDAIAGYAMIFVSILVVIDYLLINNNFKSLLFFVFVALSGWAVELLGVKTGAVFGSYQYGDTLQPQIFDVPIAIGFAWCLILLSAASILTNFIKVSFISDYLFAFMIALLMTVFDYFMESPAIKLGYWTWDASSPPAQNFFAWFAIGFSLAFIGLKTRILKQKPSSVAIHAFFAQILYFVAIDLFY